MRIGIIDADLMRSEEMGLRNAVLRDVWFAHEAL